MQIALLEDQPALVDILTTVLSLEGHQVQVYQDGAKLLHALFEQEAQRAAPDVDLVMLADTLAGSLTAGELIGAIRGRLTSEQIPIIVLSGSLEQETFLHVQFPDIPVLREPFHLQEVLAAVRRWERQG